MDFKLNNKIAVRLNTELSSSIESKIKASIPQN
jgi:hypothetical protein